MDGNQIVQQFTRIGARARVVPAVGARAVAFDVLSDRHGEFFDITLGRDIRARVIDVDPSLRHILVLAQDPGQPVKRKFLCGHDERHWFVAAVPGQSTARVRDAIQALKPPDVQALEGRLGVRGKDRLRRRTTAYIRQGEWFFVPARDISAPAWKILRDEPISRGNGSKPHLVDELFRKPGGQSVWVCQRHPGGISAEAYSRLLQRTPEARRWNWRQMAADVIAYVRGRIRHPDHATIRLAGWHRVVMNTEAQAPGAPQVRFLD